MAQPTPYKIAVPDDQLRWINERVASTRIPPGKDLPADTLWKSWGLPPDYARELHRYWTTEYDWRRVEKQINEELSQFTIPINHNGEELTIHFVHHRSEREDAIPLLFLHGWPGSFLEVRGLIAHLTNPASASDPAYHVIAPSLPGFGFSSYPLVPCSPMDMGEVGHKLMMALDYTQYIVQGGDWGSLIARVIALRHPDSCRAVHLNMVVASPPSPIWHPVALGRLVLLFLTGLGASEYEKKSLARMKWWMDWESGYNAIQGTKPQTLSYALTDSPFGMMCWIREKTQFLVDDDFKWKDDEVITWAMVRCTRINIPPQDYKWLTYPTRSHISSTVHRGMGRFTSGCREAMKGPY